MITKQHGKITAVNNSLAEIHRSKLATIGNGINFAKFACSGCSAIIRGLGACNTRVKVQRDKKITAHHCPVCNEFIKETYSYYV